MSRKVKTLRRHPWSARELVTVELDAVDGIGGVRNFDVYLDDEKIGTIFEVEGARERPTHKGSRIVHRYKRRMFWRTGWGGRIMYDSQAEAIRALIQDFEWKGRA